jgi:glucose/arabinose dehydrogenase
VRIVHDGVLASAPLAGWPTPGIDAGALWSIVVHPQFAANRFVYLYYVKKGAGEMVTRALARARFDGTSLLDVQEIFEADAWIPGGPMAGRAAFGPDGMIYLTVNDHFEHDGKNGGGEPLLAQELDNDIGKVLRIRDDGGIPADNPFVGRKDANPEVFTYGQRNVTDFAWHPETGELWTTEIAPMGGDEINVLHAGHNYGWPLVSLGKNYNLKELNDNHWYRPGMDMPAMYWTPSISPSTLTWYTGDKLAPWQGHLLVGALNGQTLQRVAFDQPMPQGERRDSLFMSLGRRWRHVVQGPDAYLYALTEKRTLGGEPDPNDATSGIVYRIEPAD